MCIRDRDFSSLKLDADIIERHYTGKLFGDAVHLQHMFAIHHLHAPCYGCLLEADGVLLSQLALVPVSYTHLDVYKRQQQIHHEIRGAAQESGQ